MTITDEMIECAAEAFCRAWGYVWDGDPTADDFAPDNDDPGDERPSKPQFRRGARAALEAALKGYNL